MTPASYYRFVYLGVNKIEFKKKIKLVDCFYKYDKYNDRAMYIAKLTIAYSGPFLSHALVLI